MRSVGGQQVARDELRLLPVLGSSRSTHAPITTPEPPVGSRTSVRDHRQLMPKSIQRPDPPGRGHRARLGASATCIFAAIFAANQSAARDAPTTLPYLPQSLPAALRFATVPVPIAPPPPLSTPVATGPAGPPGPPGPSDASGSPHPGDPAADPSATHDPNAHDPHAHDAAAGAERSDTPRLPDPTAPPGNSTSTPMPPDTPGAPSLLPDTFARQAPVTVQDLLPFFYAPPRPPSRADYEVK
jgi:hypothetical protein